MATDLRADYHEQLDDIQTGIARMSAGVTELVPRVTDILLESDLESAEYVILGDDAYDQKAVELEEACFRIIALQAPVAVDLRAVVSAIKIVADVERSADLCVNICKAARRIYGHQLDPHLRGVIQKMGNQAQALFRSRPRRTSTSTGPVRPRSRHGLVPRRPPSAVHPDHLRESRRRQHRPAGGGPARWWPGSTSGSAITP